MSTPEKRRPCIVCAGTRTLRTIREGFAVWVDCTRCASTGGFEPGPSESDLEQVGGQATLFGSEAP